MKHKKTNLFFKRIACVIAMCCAFAAHSTAAQASSWQHGDAPPLPIKPVAADQAQGAQTANPIGNDPLTTQELALAQQTAINSAPIQQASLRAKGQFRPNRINGTPDVQFLFAQHHDEDKGVTGDVRRADVLFYDYANDEVVRQIVNLKSGDVDDTLTLPGGGNQPPVTSIEATAAVQLILDHPTLGSNLRQMYAQASGHALQEAAQLGAQGGVFFASSAAGSPLESITAICKIHRCVQLFLPYDDTRFIDASNLVVDLSAGQVLWVDEALKVFINTTQVNPNFNVFLPLVVR